MKPIREGPSGIFFKIPDETTILKLIVGLCVWRGNMGVGGVSACDTLKCSQNSDDPGNLQRSSSQRRPRPPLIG